MKKYIFAFLVMCNLSAYALESMDLQIDPRQQQFVVTLKSNPTTGYQWKVTSYDQNLFKLINSHYFAPDTKLIGEGGNMTFRFAWLRNKQVPKTSDMVFTYARPWEPNGGTTQKVTLHFTPHAGKE